MVLVDSSLHTPITQTSSNSKLQIIGLLANEWISAAIIFGITRAVALLGAYSGVTNVIADQPFRNKGWVAELGLMWDSAHYATIAQHNYTYDPGLAGGSTVAFAPLYPFLMWALSLALGWLTFGWEWGNPQWGTTVAAGLLISNIAFYIALALLIKLLTPRLGKLRAALVAFMLASLPLAFFFSAMYTEGLFLLLMASAFLLARSDWRHKWLCAGLIGMLASLDRFAGLLLLPALAAEYGAQKGWKWRKIRADAAWLLLIPAGICIFLAFLWWRFVTPYALTDSMLKGWNHTGSFFLATYWESLSALWQSITHTYPGAGVPGAEDPVLHYGNGSRLYLILDLAMPLILLVGGFLARRKLWASEWVLLVLGIIYPLSTNITFSLARYTLPLWPGLIWVGTLKRSRLWLAVALILFSLGLFAWCSRIYGSARWIG